MYFFINPRLIVLVTLELKANKSIGDGINICYAFSITLMIIVKVS